MERENRTGSGSGDGARRGGEAPARFPADLRRTLVGVLREDLSPIAGSLGLLALVYGVAHHFLLPAGPGRIMAPLTFGVGLVLLGLSALVRAWRLPDAWVHPAGAVITFLAVGVTLVRLSVDPRPLQTAHLLLIVIAVGWFFISTPWLVGLLAGIFAGWIVMALGQPFTADWAYASGALLGATVVAYLIHYARLRTLRHLQALRDRDLRREQDLERALEEARLARRSTEASLRQLADVATRERQAGAALRRSQRDFRRVIEGLPEQVVIHRGGMLLYVNPAAARLFGYDPAEVVGRRLEQFIHPDDQERVRASLRSRETPGIAEYRVQRKDGSTVVLEASAAQSLVLEEGLASLVVGRDVTERRQMEARLRLADRLVSTGTLAAGIAHEINNPLTYLMGHLEYLHRALAELGGGHAPAPATVVRMRDAAADAFEGAAQVRAIVRDVKMFARPDERLQEPVDPRAVLRSALKIAGTQLRGRARLRTELGEVPRVDANPSHLAQVFVNLLVNAAQAFPPGRPAAENLVRVSSRTDAKGQAVIEVADTGEGMGASVASRIFDPFFTTKPAGEGMGLGLAICHGIVTNLGGDIQLESRVGEGTRFWITLPPSAASAEPDARVPAAEAPRERAGGRRLLIVDDEPHLGQALRLTLRDHHVEAEVCGRRALERCRRADYDLILLDLMMPGFSGMDVYRSLEHERPELARRVVFTTGGAYTPEAHAFLDQVPNARLDKPFTSADVNRLLASAA